MDAAITASELSRLLGSGDGRRLPLLIDVRRAPAFAEAPDMIRGALRRDPQATNAWAGELPRVAEVVVYCVHGHQVSQSAAQALRDAGFSARYLDHGIEGWRAAGGALAAKPVGAATRWVTRERPKIDRIACPWLIARFVDPGAEFLYVPAAEVRAVAKARQAEPYDVADVTFSHVGASCSFDAFVAHYRLGADPALARLATIVRGADTGALDLAPQAAGLLAVSLGLSRLCSDDHEMLRHGMTVYDALYCWCRDGQDETHTWNPDATRA